MRLNLVTWYRRCLWTGTALVLVVIVLGAYVRLSDAGLGCPDWPGCYGHLVLPGDSASRTAAQSAFPERELHAGKAWREMIHRYAASTLGLIIVLVAALAWLNRRSARQPVVLPLVLLGVVIFQGMLGMWTVTLLLKPLIVMGHLLGGLTTLGLLAWLLLEERRRNADRERRRIAWPVAVGLLVLIAQISLGGWTSSNYAALACTDLPTCQGQWWPAEADWREAFVLWRGLGINYEYGVLDAPARVAIHFTHRMGAMLTLAVLVIVALWARRRMPARGVQRASLLVFIGCVDSASQFRASIVRFGMPLFWRRPTTVSPPCCVAGNDQSAARHLLPERTALWLRGSDAGAGSAHDRGCTVRRRCTCLAAESSARRAASDDHFANGAGPAAAIDGPRAGSSVMPPLTSKPAPKNIATAREGPRAKPPAEDSAIQLARRSALVSALARNGLDAERAIARYLAWRAAHGFTGPDPLTALRGEGPVDVYTSMDQATLKLLADGGDRGAMQAYADSIKITNPNMALSYYAGASRLGSVAAAGRIADLLGMSDSLAASPGWTGRDPRQESLAWTLASIRQYGPMAVTPAGLARVEGLVYSKNQSRQLAVCGQSLAILADQVAAQGSTLAGSPSGVSGASDLPPFFVTERNLYERLPCRDTVAPVTPPRALEGCTANAAVDTAKEPVDLWICPNG
ncbi:MAG: COX15/CtaA family protein [Gammaproteobacteria bacterium]